MFRVTVIDRRSCIRGAITTARAEIFLLHGESVAQPAPTPIVCDLNWVGDGMPLPSTNLNSRLFSTCSAVAGEFWYREPNTVSSELILNVQTIRLHLVDTEYGA